MPPESEPPNDYVRKLQVAILDNSALTDNLTDDEAKIYLAWALPIAAQVAGSIKSETEFEEKRDALMKLLRVMSRLVTARQENDSAWFLSMLTNLSDIQTSLVNRGLSDEQRQSLATLYDADNATLLRHLTTFLSPTPPDESPPQGLTKTPSSDINTFRPPDTDVKAFEPPNRDIETFTPPPRDIQTRPSKPANGHSDY